jgi:FMNH2-dependent dimethyl sulfone monooxygenase
MVEFGLWAPVPHAIAPEPRLDAAARQAASSISDAGYVDESFAIARDVLVRGDELGYDYTLVAERFLGPDLEAWLLTAALAPLTKRIRLLTAIHPGLIAPQIAAKMGASLDRISHGRFHLNLVSGWWKDEWEMYGGRWLEDEHERYLREEEYIRVVKGLWTQDSFSFEGCYYQLHEASSPIKPVQQPYPPLFAASRTELGKELLAREADWWFPGYGYDFRDWRSNLDRVEAQIKDMRERAARYGRHLRFGISVQVLCAPTGRPLPAIGSASACSARPRPLPSE